MKSSNIKLLWILISITLFVLAIIGTVILLLAKSPNESETSNHSLANEELHSALEPLYPKEKEEKSISTAKEKWLTESANPLVSESKEQSAVDTESINQKNSLLEKNETTPSTESNKDFPQEGISTIQQRQRETTFVDESQRTASKIISGKSESLAPQKAQKSSTAQGRPSKPVTKAPKTPVAPKTVVVKYWIQVASFTILSSAEKGKEELKKKGFEAIISTKQIQDKTHYRLRLGPFNSAEEAENYLFSIKKIDKEGYNGAYITKTTSKPTTP